MDVRGQSIRLKLRNVQNISNILLRKLVQSRKNSSIQSETKLKQSTVEKLLNELFSLEDVENEKRMEEYADEIGVKIHA